MRRVTDLFKDNCKTSVYCIGSAEDMAWFRKEKKRVHVFALGDVGGLLLTGLKLLGKDSIESIGVYDVRDAFKERWETEMNQVAVPWDYEAFPEVDMVEEDNLFDCDVFVFCASLRVPPVSEKKMDVRMAQYEANAGLVKKIAGQAKDKGFSGLFAIVSDPVDPLCRAAVSAGLKETRVKGYGLGVMNARAAYYAKKEKKFASFLTEGAAFGPHGQDLVIANSLVNYDDVLSRELTEMTVQANLKMRELGFKPYMAPALSSGALSILATLDGKWHYSSVCLDGVFFGIKNRVTENGMEIQNPEVTDELFLRLEKAYENLKAIPV